MLVRDRLATIALARIRDVSYSVQNRERLRREFRSLRFDHDFYRGLAMRGLSDQRCWYAIYTKAKQEDRADSNLRAWRVETFNPKLKQERYDSFTGKRIQAVMPLFSGYIFARFEAGKMLRKVRFTRGVQSVVSFGGEPSPVDDWIVELIQSRIGEDGLVHIGEDVNPGDQVIINNGPLRNLVGILERKVSARGRVSILLTAISYQGRILVERQRVNKVT